MRSFRLRLLSGLFFLVGISLKAFAQQPNQSYPRVAGYVGVLHPLVTLNVHERRQINFDKVYTVGLPTGINIWKSSRIGFSAEFVPFVRVDSAGSKMSNFLFHPGVLISLGKGWVFAGRAAFETGGRYGFTPVLNKIVKKSKNAGYFVAIPLPVRFGNAHVASIGLGFQFGITF